MKKILTLSFIFLSLTFLSGCGGSGYAITYDTSPQGASVYCEGKKQGYSPVTLYYDFDKTKTYGKTKRCYAQWSSTGKENYSRTWNLKKFPNGVRQTLDIPKNSNVLIVEDVITTGKSALECAKIIEENKDKVNQYKAGKEKLFGFFVGQTMKVSGGTANPQLVNDILKKKLK